MNNFGLVSKNNNQNIPIIIVFVIMFVSQDTNMFSALATGKFALMRNIILICFLVGLIIMTLYKNYMNTEILLVSLIFVVSLILSMIYNNDFGAEYWVISLIIATLITSRYSLNSYLVMFEKLMLVVCIIYSIGFALIFLKPDIVNSQLFMLLQDWKLIFNHSSIYDIYMNYGRAYIRSYGPFREPGVYQMYIILAMIIRMFYIKKINYFNILIFSIALILSKSTTGYIVWFMILMLYFLTFSKKIKLTLLPFAICGITLILFGTNFLSIILSKFGTDSIHSYASRQASILTNLYFWINNPVFGTGINYMFEKFTIVSETVLGLSAGNLHITDNTNTILLFFAAFGTIPGILFTYGLWKFSSILSDKKIIALGLFISFAFVFSGEALNASCFPYILMFYGYKKIAIRNELPFKGINSMKEMLAEGK